jgi:uncharacterized protein YyaL (SSP411 family)
VANRLAHEKSPYLLQHADNPVDWQPWGDAAFARAREEDKPVFLSIGYSTCHWCHVMAHESFEDAAIASQLNRDFVSIKLDREERPDIDRVYMSFVQATTGAGGWPMSVWLTPDRKPFFGGTYFPPSSRWGRPGFSEVLGELARAWRQERPRLLESAETITNRLREMTGADEGAPDRGIIAGRDAIETGVKAFAQGFDPRHGGFGGAPKFPRPSELLFLLEASAFTGDRRARAMALETLNAMAMGGMRDHVGGGFHRYSVDAEWRVPHFEKMLYDQAQLVLAYLEAGQASGDPFYATVAEDTLDYVLSDLTSPEGAFFSAEDADSQIPQEAGPSGPASGPGLKTRPPASQPSVQEAGPSGPAHHESREGAFYVFTAADIDRLFGADTSIVRRRFGIEDRGNALADPQGEFTGQNILYIAQTIEDVASREGRSVEDVMHLLARARQTLYDARAERPRPHLDDKVITAWNGLMIAAFARAARVLVASPRRAEWREAAERAARAARARLWRADERRLWRRFRDGDAGIDGFCEDYACLAWGLLELFQATGDAAWLTWARDLVEVQTTLFSDDRDGGWFSTTGDDPTVILRLKEDYDGAEPAAASVTARNLLTLGHLLGDSAMRDRAGRTLERYGAGIGRVGRVMPLMLSNVIAWHGTSAQVVIVGARATDDTRALEAAAAATYAPLAVQIPIEPGEAQQALAAVLPWTAAMRASDGRAAAYVCQDFTCQAPVTDPAALTALLVDASAPRRILQG